MRYIGLGQVRLLRGRLTPAVSEIAVQTAVVAPTPLHDNTSQVLCCPSVGRGRLSPVVKKETPVASRFTAATLTATLETWPSLPVVALS